MLGPFPLEAVIARARLMRSTFKVVGGFADFQAALASAPRNTPALYVLRDESATPPSGMSGTLIQEVTTTVKLLLWNRHSGDAEKAEAAMTAIEQALREQFFGWRPSREFKPLSIRSSGGDQMYGADTIRQLHLTTGYRQTTQPDITP